MNVPNQPPMSPQELLMRILSGGPGGLQPSGKDVMRTVQQYGLMGPGMSMSPLGMLLGRLFQNKKKPVPNGGQR